MSKKNRIGIVTLILIGMSSLATFSCKKDSTITKKDPIITWANPSDINYGTLLSSSQLNATSDVPGTFVYTPAIGSKLNVSANQDLKVDFTPTDASNYNTATKTVKINVIVPINPTNGKTTAVFNSNVTYGTLTDQDGNVYKTVTIGTQTWMAENLRTTRYNDSTSIPNITSASEWSNLTTGAYNNYKNTTSADTIATYGRLYNWYAVNTGKLAPKGWHVPTDADWSTLSDYLINNGYGFEGSGDDIAKSLASTSGWKSYSGSGTPGNDPGSNNSTGFTALPGGYRYYDGTFDDVGNLGYWWSSTEGSTGNAVRWFMDYDNGGVFSGYSNKRLGFSVRCLRD